MPKKNERDQLCALEARRRKLDDEVESARRALRGRYAALVSDLEVERLTEREFRDILAQAIRAGGAPAVAVLKGLPAHSA